MNTKIANMKGSNHRLKDGLVTSVRYGDRWYPQDHPMKGFAGTSTAADWGWAAHYQFTESEWRRNLESVGFERYGDRNTIRLAA